MADQAMAAVVVGLLSLAGSRARRWTWLVLCGVAATFSATVWAALAAIAGLALAIVQLWPQRPNRVAGAVVGGLGGLALLRLVDGGQTGASLLLAAAAAGPVLRSGYRGSGRTWRQSARCAGGVVVSAAVLVGVAYGVALASARPTADRGVLQLRAALESARAGDLDAARSQFAVAEAAFERADNILGAWWALPARALPVVGHNARGVATALEVALDASSTGRRVADSVDLDSLSSHGGRIEPSAFATVDAPLGELLSTLHRADDRAGTIRSPWLLPSVADRADEIRSEVADAIPDAQLARDVAAILPRVLGEGGSRRYLVLFVTPVEGRATGFPGNYAELTVTDGRLEMTEFGRITDLNPAVEDPTPVLDLTPDGERYLRFGIAREWREITFPADFPTVADIARQLYAEATARPVDGVLSVDPTAIAGLLRFTGPITIPQLADPLTFETAEDFLLLDQYVTLADTPDRVDALESLGRATFDALTTGDLPAPQELARVLSPVAAQGHLRFVSFDADVHAVLAPIGLDHALREPLGDAIAVTTNNTSAGKVDLFLQRSVDYEADWNPATGAVHATLRVTLRNDAPSSGLPDYVIGSLVEGLPLGANRSYVSIYTPWLLDGASVDGRPVAVESDADHGYDVYSTRVELAPDGGTVIIELQLSGQLPVGDPYRLDVWNQILVAPDQLNVAVTVRGNEPIRADGLTVDGRTASTSEELTEPRTYEVQHGQSRPRSAG